MDFTGIFPTQATGEVRSGQLVLELCDECQLLQLGHNFPQDVLYGDNYGYRSGLNKSMVGHLTSVANLLTTRFKVQPGTTIIDIGSNDGTLLNALHGRGFRLVGVDPTAEKFRDHYLGGMEVFAELFNASRIRNLISEPVGLVTSISMFYDMPDPVDFASGVASCLAHDGIWYLEQSYMPTMLKLLSYDTICHEHLEYYSLYSLREILHRAGLKLLDVTFNQINGGSFSVIASRVDSNLTPNRTVIDWLFQQEDRLELSSPQTYLEFGERIRRHAEDLRRLLEGLRSDGKVILGLGASTKGNVLLQYAGIGPELVQAIGDVNEEKWGKVTPGMRIPIISEEEALDENPDYFLILPWHFRQGFLERLEGFMARGGNLIFPLPEIEVVGP